MNPILLDPLKTHKGSIYCNVEVYLSGRNPTWTGMRNIRAEKTNYFYSRITNLHPFSLANWRLFQRVLEE